MQGAIVTIPAQGFPFLQKHAIMMKKFSGCGNKSCRRFVISYEDPCESEVQP